MNVLLVDDPVSLRAGASLSVNVGANDDPVYLQGMAHFLEHMLFLGSKMYPDINHFK